MKEYPVHPSILTILILTKNGQDERIFRINHKTCRRGQSVRPIVKTSMKTIKTIAKIDITGVLTAQIPHSFSMGNGRGQSAGNDRSAGNQFSPMGSGSSAADSFTDSGAGGIGGAFCVNSR